MSKNIKPTYLQILLAWAVHLFTASGLIAGFMALVAMQEQDVRTAMLWLILAFIIDGIDGSFARICRVQEVLPNMDGKTIDYVVDFANFAIIPAYIFYQSDLVFDDWRLPLTSIILLVSAIYYGKTGMVSDDKYFIGFPVLWNMVVYFLIFVFDFSSHINGALILFFAVAHFVPLKYIYPSQAQRWRMASSIIAALFFVLMCVTVYLFPARNFWLTVLSVIGLAYFATLTALEQWTTIKRKKKFIQ